MNTSFAIAIVVGIAVTSVPFSAAAAPKAPELITERVSYADLNLSSDAGAQVMLSRLSRAADRVCGGRPDMGVGYHQKRRAWNKCRAGSLKEAVVQLGSAQVTQLYAADHPRSPIEVATR